MKKTTHILFTIYIFLVIWIILFKLSVSIDQLPHFRSINLIPFYYPNKTTYQIREVLDNLIIFIPFDASPVIICFCLFRDTFCRIVILHCYAYQGVVCLSYEILILCLGYQQCIICLVFRRP